MARSLFALFAALAYLLFLATFLYLVAFLADLPFIPLSVDRGPIDPVGRAVAIDVVLIALFGLQHSGMARRGFKRAAARLVPPPIERSLYVLVASLTLILLFLFWRPIPMPVWRIDHPVAAGLIWLLFAAGWAIVLTSTFLISHFELFGLIQVYQHWRGRVAAAPQFRQPFFYRVVRHPLYSGFFLAFWATPRMSAGHLLLAVGMSIYMLLAIRLEERDLIDLFGQDYARYRERVGMLTPRFGRRRPG